MTAGIAAHAQRVIELAWAAGVIDAKGRFVAVARHGKHGPLWTPRILVRASFQRHTLPERLEVVLGGSCGRMGAIGTPNADILEWHVSGAKACLALSAQIIDLLSTQARACQIHMELCERIVGWKPASFDDRTIPQDEVLERRRLAEVLNQMSRLKS